jgi:hypothetical protein
MRATWCSPAPAAGGEVKLVAMVTKDLDLRRERRGDPLGLVPVDDLATDKMMRRAAGSPDRPGSRRGSPGAAAASPSAAAAVLGGRGALGLGRRPLQDAVRRPHDRAPRPPARPWRRASR